MKKLRQQLIMKIIEQYDIDKQEDLVQYLIREGLDATQATVSRDIRELNLTKVPAGNNGGQKYASVPKKDIVLVDKYRRVFREGFLGTNTAQNLVIVKTVPGMAMGIAAAIDAMQFLEIIGSIAGDDTIMIATKTSEIALQLQKKIQNIGEKDI